MREQLATAIALHANPGAAAPSTVEFQPFPFGEGYSIVNRDTGEVIATARPRDYHGGLCLVCPRTGRTLGLIYGTKA